MDSPLLWKHPPPLGEFRENWEENELHRTRRLRRSLLVLRFDRFSEIPGISVFFVYKTVRQYVVI